jgi:hypothetical protein
MRQEAFFVPLDAETQAELAEESFTRMGRKAAWQMALSG